MPAKYVVFRDDLSGIVPVNILCADTLEEAVQNIHEGVNGSIPSQHWMYFIYVLYSEKVPIVASRFDVYKYVKAVAGVLVEREYVIHKRGLQYALCHQVDEKQWLFADKLF